MLRRRREIRTRIMDSTRWSEVRLRASDIVIASWGKSGTTLTVQMISQLICAGAEGVGGKALWVEALPFAPKARMLAALEALPDPRLLKTHLPFDALLFDRRVKYIYVGRDARDVVWSAHHHHASLTGGAIDAFNGSGGTGPLITPCTCSVRDCYLQWLEHDALPGSPLDQPFWPHVRSWWEQRHRPNVLLLHHAAISADMPRELRRVAAFLGIDLPEAAMPAVLAHCDIGYMRAHAANLPAYTRVFERGAMSFFNVGSNGRWKDQLTAQEIARCDAVAARALGADCAHWLRSGEPPRGAAAPEPG
jgi:aryl sulfotransferase